MLGGWACHGLWLVLCWTILLDQHSRSAALCTRQDPGFDAEPATPRPAAAINWGSAAPSSKAAPPAAASTTGALSFPPRSSAASSYADLSDRYLDRPKPAAAAPGLPAAPPAQPPKSGFQQSAPSAAGSTEGAAAQAQSTGAADSIFIRSAAVAAPASTSLGLLPAPDAVTRPPLWVDVLSADPPQRGRAAADHAEAGTVASLTMPNGHHTGSRAGSDATTGDDASADAARRQHPDSKPACSTRTLILIMIHVAGPRVLQTRTFPHARILMQPCKHRHRFDPRASDHLRPWSTKQVAGCMMPTRSETLPSMRG